MKIKNKKLWIWIVAVLAGLVFLGAAAIFGVNVYVTQTADDYILSSEQAVALENVDCILVLGCGVGNDGTPSPMLHDRLKRGVSLYEAGAAPKLLMSGDHGRDGYDEVDAMKSYAVGEGVPAKDVFMDHAGFSTYESMYRALDVFEAEKVIIVTQQYHLYRAVYIARSLGIDAYGVSSDYRTYASAAVNEVREVLARVKDAVTCVFRPEPTYRGPAIPIWGDGNLTNDENSDFT